MWQAQLQGSKSWQLAPTPECADVCDKFEFIVEPGDAGKTEQTTIIFIHVLVASFNLVDDFTVLLDTRNWYHGTSVLNGEFSFTIQSEYG